MSSSAKVILYFGDQTDQWIDGLDFIRKEARFAPWLRTFMADACQKLKAEMNDCESIIKDSLGNFATLYDLAEMYRHTPDETGFANAFLIYVMRAAMLLRCIKREPHLLENSQDGPEWLGISGGLMSLAPLAVAKDFDTLYDACIEVAGLLCRVSNFCCIRSRAVEDKSGTWGWAVLGISKEDLGSALDQYQSSVGIPPLQRAHVAVTGDRWASIIGPPSVLERCLKECPTVNGLAKNKLNIRSLQHAIPVSDADLDYIVGNSALVNKSLDAQHRIWGTDHPDATYGTLGEVLRTAVLQCVSRPLDIVEVVKGMATRLDSCDQIDIKVLGTSGHTPYLATALKKQGRAVNVHHEIGAPNQIPDDAQTGGRIAIVGMAGRGPGSDDLDEFWSVLMDGKDMAEEITPDRFDLDEFFAAEHDHKDPKCTTTSKFGCFMNKPGNFDARFFRISPREAIFMDPGHRQFLMSSYEALENAGYSEGKSADVNPDKIGVFFGQSNDDWNGMAHHLKGCDAYTLQGAQRAFGAGRLAFHMGWEGPTYSLDSACATTSSSIHLACLSLISGDVDMAVCGAANVVAYPHSWTSLSKSGILSKTGNCKPFREDADGYCRADFVGSVVLKRLGDAVAHNDKILAVISGSGRNHSGNSPSITTSDADAQERLFNKVLANAGVLPDEISYVEMHGTGTQIGDPAEMRAVTKVFKHRQGDDLVLGSIKANIGHSEAAAGMSSLLKCILMFQKGMMPPQGGMPHALNPKFPSLKQAKLEILSAAREFKPKGAKPRRAMINNFDAAGGNACLLLEEYSGLPTGALADGVQVPWEKYAVVVSARTASSLDANKRRLLKYLEQNPDCRIQDVSYTTTARRIHHPIRAAYLVSSIDQLKSSLTSDISSGQNKQTATAATKPVVLVFTGQGSAYGGMGNEMYQTSSVFRTKVDQCVKICADLGFAPFLDIITDKDVDLSIKEPAQIHLALLTLEISLAYFWQSQAGLEPSMVMGHSLGEYAALHVAGVLSLTDVFYLVGKRAQLLEELCDTGSCTMLSVASTAETAQKFIDSKQDTLCSISCSNAPKSTVIGGLVDDIKQLEAEMSDFNAKQLPVPYAFHTFQMDAILEPLVSLARGVTFSPPKFPVASTLLAKIVDSAGTFNPGYMAQQTRQQVQFVKTIQAVDEKLGEAIWLEVGPTQLCGSFVKATLSPTPAPGAIMSTLQKDSTSWSSFFSCLVKLYEQGVDIDWLRLCSPYRKGLRLVNLPTYAWDLQEFWITHTERGRQSLDSPVSNTAPTQISTCAQFIVEETPSQVVMQTSIADPGMQAIIEGHRIRDVAICPGSAFCDAALTAAQRLFQSSERVKAMEKPVWTIRNLSLRSPLRNEPDATAEHLVTTAIVSKQSSEDSQVTFSYRNRELGGCTVSISEGARNQSARSRTNFFIKARLDDLVTKVKQGLGHRIYSSIFYSLFGPTVKYSPDFKRLKEAYVSEDFSEAAAEITLGSNPEGTRFTSSPYHGESLVHLAGFMLNSNPSRPRSSETTFMMDNLESVQTINAAALVPGRTYWSFARVASRTDDSATCDVWVFEHSEASSELVMVCFGLRFHEVQNIVLDRLLGKNKPVVQVSEKTPSSNKLPKPTVTKPALEVPLYQPQASVPIDNHETPAGDASVENSSGLCAAILGSICRETGTDLSQLTDDTALADIGVDSIMAIEITASVKKETGIDLNVTTLIDHPTIGALRVAFGLDADVGSTDKDYDMLTPTSELSESSDWSVVTPAGASTRNTTPSTSPLEQKPPPKTWTADAETQTPAAADTKPTEIIKETLKSVAAPKARIVLLHGRLKDNQTPLYLIADGTGSIATYIHLPPFNTKSVIYGIESPFTKNPELMAGESGIPNAAKHIVDAVIESRPHGPLYIGGFSGGGMLGYEVCRQLADQGRKVDGLLIIDICSPRTKVETSLVKVQPEDGWEMFQAMAAQDQFWNSNSQSPPMQHLLGLFRAVANYHPEPMTEEQRPKKTSVIWAERGMGRRCQEKPELKRKMLDMGFPAEAYPGFMEDPRLGALAWGFVDKRGSEGALGPNGWDKYVGNVGQCLSVDADHLDMPMPGHVHHMRAKIEEALAYFDSCT
ncbi:hypothetical protein PspLS_11650 [Pyricularia sp. CBS 133598]|nr:hypothetical protein PspLS_11650 [Pyricularia sp. CBS 133598]